MPEERIGNAAPEKAPEITIPQTRRGLSLVPDEEKKIQSFEKAEFAGTTPSASSATLTSEGALTFPGTEKKFKEPKKKTTAGGTVPPRRLGLKIGAPLVGAFLAASGTGIGLGESDNLPDPLQKTYDHVKVAVGLKDRITYDKDGTPRVDITKTSQPIETTQAPTTTVVETTTTTQEATTTTEAIINAPLIEGLTFDNVTKTYIAEAGNPYGLEAGTEAGVYTKEALKFDGEMEDAIGLNPAVIESLQNTINKDTGEFTTFIPVDLSETKGVEVSSLEVTSGNLEGIILYGVNVTKGTIIYAEASGEFYSGSNNGEDPDKDKSIDIMYGTKELNAFWTTNFRDGNIIPPLKRVGKSYLAKEENGKEVYEEIPVYIYEAKLGEPLVEINSEAILDLTSKEGAVNGITFKTLGNYQVCLGNEVFKNDGKTYQINILEIPNKDKENLKVFILPKKS